MFKGLSMLVASTWGPSAQNAHGSQMKYANGVLQLKGGTVSSQGRGGAGEISMLTPVPLHTLTLTAGAHNHCPLLWIPKPFPS